MLLPEIMSISRVGRAECRDCQFCFCQAEFRTRVLFSMQVAELYIMIFVLTYYCRYNYQLLPPYHVNTGHLVNYLLLSFSSVIVSKLATTALAYIDQLLAVLVDLIC